MDIMTYNDECVSFKIQQNKLKHILYIYYTTGYALHINYLFLCNLFTFMQFIHISFEINIKIYYLRIFSMIIFKILFFWFILYL